MIREQLWTVWVVLLVRYLAADLKFPLRHPSRDWHVQVSIHHPHLPFPHLLALLHPPQAAAHQVHPRDCLKLDLVKEPFLRLVDLPHQLLRS